MRHVTYAMIVFALFFLPQESLNACPQEDAKPSIESLSTQLEQAQGEERLGILQRLVDLGLEERRSAEVVAWCKEAQALLPSSGDPKRELLNVSALACAYLRPKDLVV